MSISSIKKYFFRTNNEYTSNARTKNVNKFLLEAVGRSYRHSGSKLRKFNIKTF